MHDPEDPVSLPGNGVTCIYKDLSGNIWLGTDRGLALFNPEAENFIHFHHSEDGVPHTVFDIRQFDGNKLWIAMEFGGIAILDLTQRMFLSPDQVRFQYIKEGDDEYSLSNSTVRCLFQDSFKMYGLVCGEVELIFLAMNLPILMFIVILLSSIRVVA